MPISISYMAKKWGYLPPFLLLLLFSLFFSSLFSFPLIPPSQILHNWISHKFWTHSQAQNILPLYLVHLCHLSYFIFLIDQFIPAISLGIMNYHLIVINWGHKRPLQVIRGYKMYNWPRSQIHPAPTGSGSWLLVKFGKIFFSLQTSKVKLQKK